MPTAYNVSAAAAVVGVSPSTLRNWLKQYATHLSPGATPPPGQDRVLTDVDVAKLQFVKQQRDLLKDYPDIAKDLEAMPVDTEIAPFIDLQASTPVTPVAEAVEGLQRPAMTSELIQALQMIVSRQDEGMRREIDLLKQRQDAAEARQIEKYQSFIIGILIGVVVVLVVLGILAIAR